MQMRFGPSGNSESFFAEGHKTTIEQPKWLYENFALDAFEYSFGRGVRITEKSARQIGEAFEAYGIQKAYMRLILSIWLRKKSRKKQTA